MSVRMKRVVAKAGSREEAKRLTRGQRRIMGAKHSGAGAKSKGRKPHRNRTPVRTRVR
jgi:hypothetical protein